MTGKHRYRTERLAQLVLIEGTLRANPWGARSSGGPALRVREVSWLAPDIPDPSHHPLTGEQRTNPIGRAGGASRLHGPKGSHAPGRSLSWGVR